jgi:hypothetical protein
MDRAGSDQAGSGSRLAPTWENARDGYSIGKITYEEYTYYIAGKSEDEARHAQPKTINDLHTTEIQRRLYFQSPRIYFNSLLL